jgi:tRNA(Arg) A34 adenosine deaminase TadA
MIRRITLFRCEWVTDVTDHTVSLEATTTCAVLLIWSSSKNMVSGSWL